VKSPLDPALFTQSALNTLLASTPPIGVTRFNTLKEALLCGYRINGPRKPWGYLLSKPTGATAIVVLGWL